jgi:hypothetical protein
MSQTLRDQASTASALTTLLRQRPAQAPQRIARIPVASEQQDPLAYDGLRAAALLLAQAASRTQWTDYNLHDPGVTLLEAFCYALTEDIYAHQQSVPTLLGLVPGDVQADDAATSSISSAALARFALHGPGSVLTCRPSTAHDYQRWLYDLWPQARHMQISPQDDRRGRPTGLWQLSRLAQETDSKDVAQAFAQTRAYWGQRNLGEDLLENQKLRKPRWVRLRVQIRVTGEREVADVLSELLTRCDDIIAARPYRQTCQDTPSAERGGGPLVQQAWVSTAQLERCQAAEVKFNDLALGLRDIAGLLDVEQLVLEETPALCALSGLPPLALLPENSGCLPLRGADWALRLAWPRSPEDLVDWRVSGQSSKDQIPLHQLWQQLEDVRRTSRRESIPARSDVARWHRSPPEKPNPYIPASSHLPGLYRAMGLGHDLQELQVRHDRTTGQRLQWHAYLALLEQWPAHSRAQRQHLAELFDLGHALGPSYWWDLPSNAQLPGLEPCAASDGVYLRERGQLERDIFHSVDAALERRARVLDQLLALHGEQLAFEALQGLPCYWASDEWTRHLLRCKRRFARHVLTLTGQRNAAFDYSRPMLGQRKNNYPLSLRLALMLGMAHSFARPLTQALQYFELKLLPDDTDAVAQAQVHSQDDSATVQPLHGLPISDRPLRGAALRQTWRRLRLQLSCLRTPLPPALLRCAVHADNFYLEGGPGSLRLCLRGKSAIAQRWVLASVDSELQASQLAAQLQQFACAVQRQCEGLHLVEHVLLRPYGQGADALAAFHRQRLSIVLPAWTARGADPRFQSLCRAAVALHTPAHLESRVLFLDSPDLAVFEQLYAAWLGAKRAHCQLPATQHASGALMDACAAALSDFLQGLWLEVATP